MEVFSSPAVKKALDEVLNIFQQETGVSINAVYEPTGQLLRRIDAGESFDVMIAVTESLASLTSIIHPHSVVAVARAGIGVAVKRGTPEPDISTADSFVQTLRAARSVAYSGVGASGAYFATLLVKLGLAHDVGARATVVEKGYVAEAVLTGIADIAIQQLSELLFVPQAQIVGSLPAELQHYTELSAAVSTQSSEPTQAQAFVNFLTSASARTAYLQARLELPRLEGKDYLRRMAI